MATEATWGLMDFLGLLVTKDQEESVDIKVLWLVNAIEAFVEITMRVFSAVSLIDKGIQ